MALKPRENLLTAIQERWNTSSDILAACGPLYANEVPPRDEDDNPITVPYSYLELGKSAFEWTTEPVYYEMNSVEIYTFAFGATAAEDAVEVIRQTFDWQPLPFSFTTTIRVEPINTNTSSEMVRYKDGRVIYRGYVCYEVLLERTLA